ADNGVGGAIFVQQVSGTITNGSFTGNSSGQGGAIADGGGLAITGTTLSQNSALIDGGALWAGQTDSLTMSTLSNNKVTNALDGEGGGGVFQNGGMITVAETTFADNQVTVTNNSANAGGGGMFVLAGLNMTQSTLYTNQVHGGISGAASGGCAILTYANSATVVNSTMVANSTSTSDGGGIMMANNASATVTNATLYGNSAGGNGGDIDDPQGSLTLGNSILAAGTNNGTAGELNTAGGSFTDNDYNLIQHSVSGNPLTGTHDLFGDPQLVTLANNGGPTETMAETVNSQTRGKIPYVTVKNLVNCGANYGAQATVDQRGYSRGSGNVCDIGAFEYAGIAVAKPRPMNGTPPKRTAHVDRRLSEAPPRQRRFVLPPP
ncbi:MAG: hypothetical protein JO199_01060, partial [Candidatus Eremiobacteraeota bacterium]|nr:hypothetical protein [Candidatus Eremiobacteraeota bacterium]